MCLPQKQLRELYYTMSSTRRINWTNTLFLTITPLVAIVGTGLLITTGHFHALTLLFAILYTGATGVTITAGYHRLFAHRTYKTVWPIKLVFLLLGAASFEGSALEWCTDHRNHHYYTDTDRDPYSVTKGFWHAHMGWLFFLDTSKRDFSNIKDLTSDRLVAWQHRHFVSLAILMGFIVPMGIAALWGDALGGLIMAGALRIAFNHQVTFCINSVCHVFGKVNYSTEQSAKDNWLTALITYGEGYHNYHHTFMFDYRNGIHFYHFDPAKWLIRGLAYVGLTSQLKRASQKQIIRDTIQADENLVLQQMKQASEALSDNIRTFLQPLKERIMQTTVLLEQLEADYRGLKAQKMAYLQGKMTEYRQSVKSQRQRLQQTRHDLQQAMLSWGQVIQQCHQKALSSSV